MVIVRKSYMKVCLILNGYQDRAVCIWCGLFFSPSSLMHWIFVFGADEQQSLQKKKWWIHKMNCLLVFWMLLQALRNVQIYLNNAIFAHELQIAPRLTVGF